MSPQHRLMNREQEIESAIPHVPWLMDGPSPALVRAMAQREIGYVIAWLVEHEAPASLLALARAELDELKSGGGS